MYKKLRPRKLTSSLYSGRARSLGAVWLALLIALGMYFLAPNPQTATMQGTDKKMPTLSGDAAVDYLKKEANYASLADAIASVGNDARPNLPQLVTKLTAFDGVANGGFGGDVAISGNTAVVGMTGAGAYVFVRSGTSWTLQQKLTADHANPEMNFGYSVAISGDTIIVGELRYYLNPNVRTGAASVFVRTGTTWAMQQRLLASDGQHFDSFGFRVAISGDTAIVGAPNDDGPTADQGSAYIFVRSGSAWTQQQKLTTPVTGPTDMFGESVGISGDTVIVGKRREDIGVNTNQGAVFVFVRSGSTWTQQQRLTDSNITVGGLFGYAAAISGNTVVVSGVNLVYVFVRTGTTWAEQQRLTAPEVVSADSFGQSVAISDDMVIAGAYRSTISGNFAQGYAYVFQRCGTVWTRQEKLLAADGGSNDYFGWNVGISGNTAIVGAPQPTASGVPNRPGAAYVVQPVGEVEPCLDVTLSIDVPDTRFKVGDQFPAVVKVNSTRPESRIITFADPLLRERPFSGQAADSILTLDPYPLPPPFELTAANPTRSFTVPVRVNKLGTTELVSSLSYTGPGGIQGTVTKAKKVSAPPFTATVNVTPRQNVLDQTPPAKKSARCRAIEAANVAIKNCIEITATVKNSSDRTISNVNIPGADNPLSLINEVDPKILGEPLTEIEHVFPPSPVTLAPGAEITWTWRMNAFDAPASLEFEPTIFGVMGGQEVGGHGNKTFQLLENVLLKWGMRPTDGRTNYLSGQNVRADGFIENVSTANGGPEKTLLVQVYQIPSGNVGGGFVYPTTYSGPSPTDYTFFNLPAVGPAKRVDLRSVFRSLRTNRSSRADIEFGVSLWIIEDSGLLTPASDRALLDDENYPGEFPVSFSGEPPIVDDYVEDCMREGFPPILCSFDEAFAGDAVDGAYGLIKFGLSAESAYLGGFESLAQASANRLWAFRTMLKAAMGNQQAKRELLLALYTDYLRFHNLGVLAGQVPGQAAMGFEAFSVQAGDAIGHFLQAIEQGDLNALQVQVGHFLGANPDLLFEPLVVGRSFSKLMKGLSRAAGGIADNVFTAAARNEALQQAASIEARIAAAEASGADLATALAAGDVLKPGVMRKVFGTSSELVERLHTFAKKNEVILAFRARHPRAQTLLDAGLAWAKPQALKFKTISEIDMRFLGYRRRAEATLEIIEPPASIIGKVDAELKIALDQYMDRMVTLQPELAQNATLRKEVRDRLKTRAKEWNQYVPQMKLDNLTEEVKIGVNFGAGDQFVNDVAEDVGVKSYRKIERAQDGVIIDPVEGGERKVFTLKMEGPNGLPARPVVGDIDFLGILDKYGRMIREGDKRFALYTQLEEFMEHGESFTFRYNELRRNFVECCIEGGEAMMTVGPWEGEPRAGYFVNNLSVMDEFNAAFKRVRGTEPVTGPAGEVLLDPNGNPVEVTLRHEDVTGEYSLINGTPILNHPSSAFVARFAPLTFEIVYAEFLARLKYYFPSLIGRIISGDNRRGEVESPAIFRRNGPVLQIALPGPDLTESNELRVWTLANGWRPITRVDALAAGEPGIPDMAPNSSLPDGAARGSRSLTITPGVELSFTGDFFAPGDGVVINPGGTNQEVARILSVNPIVLINPLIFEHKAGEMIAFINTVPLTVSGRVTTPTGLGLRNAVVSMIDSLGIRRTATTSSFGVYSFTNVALGGNYTISVASKRYRFAPKVMVITDNLSNVDFVGLE